MSRPSLKRLLRGHSIITPSLDAVHCYNTHWVYLTFKQFSNITYYYLCPGFSVSPSLIFKHASMVIQMSPHHCVEWIIHWQLTNWDLLVSIRYKFLAKFWNSATTPPECYPAIFFPSAEWLIFTNVQHQDSFFLFPWHF